MSGLDHEDRALLEAARPAHDPRPGDRARVRAALALRIGGGGGGPPGAAAPPSEGAPAAGGSAVRGALNQSVVAKALVAGALIAGALLLAPRARTLLDGTEPAPAPPSVQDRADSLTPTAAPPSSPAAVAPSDAPTVSIADLPDVERPRPGPRALGAPPAEPSPPAPPAAAATASAPSTLDEETRVIGLAQHALRSGLAAQAMRYLDDHERRFPAGVLSDERTAARVVSLCSLGRAAEARAIADRFIAARPRSPLVHRLERACAPDSK